MSSMLLKPDLDFRMRSAAAAVCRGTMEMNGKSPAIPNLRNEVMVTVKYEIFGTFSQRSCWHPDRY